MIPGLRPGELRSQKPLPTGAMWLQGTGFGWGSTGGGVAWGPKQSTPEAGTVRGAEDCGPGSWPGGGRRGRRERAGRAAGGVRGEGAGAGQRAGSRRCSSRYRGPALPPAARARRPGGLGPSPAVCISLAGGGAGVERNRLHLERCLFFLTSQRRQTTPRAPRPDREPSLRRGQDPGRPDERRAASPRPGTAAAGLGGGSRWGRERLSFT